MQPLTKHPCQNPRPCHPGTLTRSCFASGRTMSQPRGERETMPGTLTRSMRYLWGYNARRGGFPLGARKDSIFRIDPHCSPFSALSTACFTPVTHPSPAHRWLMDGRARKKQQRCAQGVPPNRRDDRRHCIAPATLWCIRPVEVRCPIAGQSGPPGQRLVPRQLLCLQSRSKFAPCAKLSREDLPFLTPRPQADQMSPGRNNGCKW